MIDGVPTAADLVQMGMAHHRETKVGKTLQKCIVIHDEGHAELGRILRDKGRRNQG